MSYATIEQYQQWTAHLALDAIEDVAGLLERASRDLDVALGWPAPVTASLRLGPAIEAAMLTAHEVNMLARACVAQAAYRLTVGEEDIIEGASRVLSVGTVAFATTAPDLLGGEAKNLLAGTGLLRRSGTVLPPLVDGV